MKKFLLSIGLVLATGAVFAQAVIAPGTTPKVDETDYGVVTLPNTNIEVTLKNNWIYSSAEGFANYPAIGANGRSIAYAKGKVYVPDRNTTDNKYVLHVFDAATGNFIKTAVLPSQMFQTAAGDGYVFFPVNSLATDSKGRLVLANLSTNFQAGPLQVWVMEDEDDANPVKLLDFAVPMDLVDALRVDVINVYGDMKGDGYVIAGVAGAPYFAKWDIKGGTFTLKGEGLEFVDPETETNPTIVLIKEGSLTPTTAANAGTAPYVYPVSDQLFYLDGHAIVPSLFDMSGNVVDGFFNKEDKAALAIAPSTGANGLSELTIGGEVLLVAGKYNHDPKLEATERNSFILYHLDANTPINEGGAAVVYSQFPAMGFGSASNASYVVLPKVNQVDDNTAEIYTFTMNNGFGKYTLSVKGGQSIEEGDTDVITVSVEGDIIKASDIVASIEVYNVAGVKVASASATDFVTAPTAGVYVVTTVDNSGASATSKVLVK